MTRANEITDQQLEGFCEWYGQRFKKRMTRRAWFETSLEGAMHVPARDVKDLLRRMEALDLIRATKANVVLLKR